MSLPVLTKTWQFAVNQAVVAQPTLLATGQKLMRLLKTSLIGFALSPWTVVSSSDAVTAGAGDKWLADTNLTWANSGTAHSWIVLRQTGIATNYEICIDLNSASSVPQLASIIVSPSAGFTGGSTTNRPTATDEMVLLTTAVWGTSSINQNYQLHVMQSTDGQCTRAMICTSGISSTLFLLFDRPNNTPTSGWTNPSISIVYGSNGTSNVITFTNLSSASGTTNPIKVRIGSNNFTVALTGEGWNAVLSGILSQTTPFQNTSDVDSNWIMLPVGIAGYNTGSRGRLGTLYDLWWGSGGVNPADTYPNDASQQFAQFGSTTNIGSLIFPWNGTTPLLA